MLSFKSEALKWAIPQSEEHLTSIIKSYLSYYHHERNQQGLDEKIIKPGDEIGCKIGNIKCKNRLGGSLKYYYREAA